jgi:chorismate mutase
MMKVRGIRGAITVTEDTEPAILEATRTLLEAIVQANGVEEDDVASILFTTTQDLTACFPAKAAREMGWNQAALLGFQEMNVPNSVNLCVRILVHWNTTKSYSEIVHVYLRGAESLRPDLSKK